MSTTPRGGHGISMSHHENSRGDENEQGTVMDVEGTDDATRIPSISDNNHSTADRCIEQGRFGALHQVSLTPTPATWTLRPGEDPVQYECVLPYQYHSTTTTSTNTQHPINNNPTKSPLVLCLHRFKIWWMKPIWVSNLSQVPPETIMLLYYQSHSSPAFSATNADKVVQLVPPQSQEEESCISETDVLDRTNASSATGIYHLLLAVPLPMYHKMANTTASSAVSDTNRANDEPVASPMTFATSSLRGGDDWNVSQQQQPLTNGCCIRLCSNSPSTGLYVGQHPTDPYSLIEEGVKLATNVWSQTPPRGHHHDSSTTATANPESIIEPPTATTGHILTTNGSTATAADDVEHMQPRDTGSTMLSTLGWCTRNAFYTSLSGTKIVDAVIRMKQHHGVPVRWMIIDDGWQDTVSSSGTSDERESSLQHSNTEYRNTESSNNQVTTEASLPTKIETADDGEQWSRRLRSLREDPEKFRQCSLKETVSKLRDGDDRLLDAILVWHTLAGYWLGLESMTQPEQTVEPKASLSPEESTLPPSRLYYPRFSRGVLKHDPSASDEYSATRGIGIPDNASQFYHRYHTEYLSQVCGVDGVKVDAQAVTGILHRPMGLVKAELDPEDCSPPSLRMQAALAESVQRNFAFQQSRSSDSPGRIPYDDSSTMAHMTAPSDNSSAQRIAPVIHCMAHSPEIFFRLPSLYSRQGGKCFFRAADDYYPDQPASHGAQIVACAYNSLLFGHVAIPDWDMFTTTIRDTRIVQMHAIARCLSGGPIYLSDSPNETPNPAVLDWICCPDGTTFPFRRAAVPITESLLSDPFVNHEMNPPLVVWNINDQTSMITGIFGVFCLAGSGSWDPSKLSYCGATEMDSQLSDFQTVQIRPYDIPAFSATTFTDSQFIVIGFFSNFVKILASPDELIEMKLTRMQSEAVVVYPVVETEDFEVVALGMHGRINGAGSLLRFTVEPENTVAMEVTGCGIFVMAIRPQVPRNGAIAIATVALNGSFIQPTSWNDLQSHEEKYDKLTGLGFEVIAITLPQRTVKHNILVKIAPSPL